MAASPGTPLQELAERAGIIPEYLDQSGRETRRTSDETRVRLLGALGIAAANDADIRDAIERFEESDRRPLPPVRVVTREGATKGATVASLASGKRQRTEWELEVEQENGTRATQRGEAKAGKSFDITFDDALPEGYHELNLRVRGGAGDLDLSQTLIVVPPHCPSATRLAGPHGLFGLTANLYTIRSHRNWGIGDFTDLGNLLSWAGISGAAFLGVNPLHALRNRGDDISPYSPISRVYRNVAYIDVERVPELAESAEARSLYGSAAFTSELARLRATNAVEYERVIALKRPVLEALHQTFSAQRQGGSNLRTDEYDEYLNEEGEPLRSFATWVALQEHFERLDGRVSWREWPEAFHDPRSAAVAEFREKNARAVDFHCYLQFLLDEQLELAAQQGKASGLSIGLYQDLAIGTAPNGSDTWLMPDLFVQGAAVGAPPDDYSVDGQNWGLPPLHPHRLRESRYRYWIDLVRTSMRHSGALRIDHVMGLFRQFWVPEGCHGKDGAYVRFPSEDLLGILALESTRANAMVVGEDLGTVPPDVPPALERWQILSSKVLYFEREGDGGFKPSATYEKRSLATANTHDMPTIAGYWAGRDIALRETVGMMTTPEERERAENQRRHERWMLAQRLTAEGLLPRMNDVPSDLELRRAVHEFLCRSPAALVGFSLDDLVGEVEPVNVPGVGADRFKSWTRRLTPTLEEITSDPTVRYAMGCSRRGAR